jgi:hypothetical protein
MILKSFLCVGVGLAPTLDSREDRFRGNREGYPYIRNLPLPLSTDINNQIKKGGRKGRPYNIKNKFYSNPRFFSSGSIFGPRPRKRL